MYLHFFHLYLTLWSVTSIFFLCLIFFFLLYYCFSLEQFLYRMLLLWSICVYIFILKETLKGKKKDITTDLKVDLNLDVIFYNKKKKFIFACYYIL